MSYIGSTPITQSFISGTDYFNGNGSTTAFTLSRTVASVNDIQAVVNNVVQVPNDAYTISGTTITFTSAPSSGTQNVYVRYLSTTTQAITPSQGTVSWNTLDANTQQDLGISFKNKIINGNMVIDQRNAGAVYTGVSNNQYTLDRWVASVGQAGKMSVQQNAGSVTPPVNFNNYLGITVASAVTPLSATDYFQMMQRIEGFNVADLNWGSVNAQTITLSFWVRSNLTGTFGGAISNLDQTRNYVFSYTINSANTWEKKSITITGDTTGTWNKTNGIGLWLNFGLGTGTTYSGTAGSWTSSLLVNVTGNTNLMASTSNNWYITGVQLEVGTQATTFTTAGGSYGAELQLCYRYFSRQTFYGSGVWGGGGSVPVISAPCVVPMRVAPTIAWVSSGIASNGAANYNITALNFQGNASVNGSVFGFTVTGGTGSAAQGCIVADPIMTFSAEL